MVKEQEAVRRQPIYVGGMHCLAGLCKAKSREGDQLGDFLQIQIEVWRHAVHVRVSRSDVPRVEPSDAKRLRALEDKNGKLKKLLANRCWTTPCCETSIQKNGDARDKAECGGSPVRSARCKPATGV